jgi:hypothetical protein
LSILASQTSDLNGCLQNCSSSGICLINSGIIYCECFEYFTGSACQLDMRPCASNPCLNNSTCVNNFTEETYSFECQCQNTYYGMNCERQIDLCQNVTCNNHGYCSIEQNEGRCKCFTGYYGDKCEIESAYVKFVQSVQLTSSIICFIVIGVSVFLIVLNGV